MNDDDTTPHWRTAGQPASASPGQPGSDKRGPGDDSGSGRSAGDRPRTTGLAVLLVAALALLIASTFVTYSVYTVRQLDTRQNPIEPPSLIIRNTFWSVDARGVRPLFTGWEIVAVGALVLAIAGWVLVRRGKCTVALTILAAIMVIGTVIAEVPPLLLVVLWTGALNGIAGSTTQENATVGPAIWLHAGAAAVAVVAMGMSLDHRQPQRPFPGNPPFQVRNDER